MIKIVPPGHGAKVACAITFDIDTDIILHLEHRERTGHDGDDVVAEI